MTSTLTFKDGTTAKLEATMGFYLRFRKEYGCEFSKVPEQDKDDITYVLTLAYCLIQPKPGYSLDEFASKLDIRQGSEDLATAIKEAFSGLSGDPVKEDQIKNS